MRSLRLTLSADKTETKLLADGSNIEPIKLKLTFANVGREPLTLDMSPAAWYVGTSIVVIGPDGSRAPYGRVTDLSPFVHPGVRQARAEDFTSSRPATNGRGPSISPFRRTDAAARPADQSRRLPHSGGL